MAEDGAMPQADGCCEELDPDVAEATLAKDLAGQIQAEFYENGYSWSSVTIPRETTVGCLEDALHQARTSFRNEDVELYIVSDPPTRSVSVRFRPRRP